MPEPPPSIVYLFGELVECIDPGVLDDIGCDIFESRLLIIAGSGAGRPPDIQIGGLRKPEKAAIIFPEALLISFKNHMGTESDEGFTGDYGERPGEADICVAEENPFSRGTEGPSQQIDLFRHEIKPEARKYSSRRILHCATINDPVFV